MALVLKALVIKELSNANFLTGRMLIHEEASAFVAAEFLLKMHLTTVFLEKFCHLFVSIRLLDSHHASEF